MSARTVNEAQTAALNAMFRVPAGVAFYIDGPNADELEQMAIALLDFVAKEAGQAEATCPCCADRAQRFRGALEALCQKQT